MAKQSRLHSVYFSAFWEPKRLPCMVRGPGAPSDEHHLTFTRPCASLPPSSCICLPPKSTFASVCFAVGHLCGHLLYHSALRIPLKKLWSTRQFVSLFWLDSCAVLHLQPWMNKDQLQQELAWNSEVDAARLVC